MLGERQAPEGGEPHPEACAAGDPAAPVSFDAKLAEARQRRARALDRRPAAPHAPDAAAPCAPDADASAPDREAPGVPRPSARRSRRRVPTFLAGLACGLIGAAVSAVVLQPTGPDAARSTVPASLSPPSAPTHASGVRPLGLTPPRVVLFPATLPGAPLDAAPPRAAGPLPPPAPLRLAAAARGEAEHPPALLPPAPSELRPRPRDLAPPVRSTRSPRKAVAPARGNFAPELSARITRFLRRLPIGPARRPAQGR